MRHAARLAVMAALCLVLGARASASHAAELAPLDRTEAPSLVLAGGAQLPLREVRYDVDVSGVVARVHLTQTYEGPSSGPAVDADYVFPLSTRAAVYALTMQVGARTIQGLVKERASAASAYEAARAQGQVASLLEQQRPNVFQMRVANIRSGQVVQVEVDYVELLVPTEGVYHLVVPGAVGERYEAAPSALAGDLAVTAPRVPATGDTASLAWREISIHLEGGVPVQWVDSSTHAIVQTPHDDSVDVGLADAELDPRRDFELVYTLGSDDFGTGVLRFDADSERYVLAMVQPPERMAPDQIPPRELVFVLDTSGSMDGFPIETARALVRRMVSDLRPVDRFNVLAFAGSAEVLAPASLAPTRKNLDAAEAFLTGLGAGGGTDLRSALRAAFELPPAGPHLARTFAIVTDGYVDAEPATFELIRQRAGDASVFTFGIGESVNRYLIEGMAHAGQGQAFICTSAARAAAVADDFRDAIDAPALTNVRIAFEGLDAYDLEPAAVPDVYAHRPVFVLGKYTTIRPDAAIVVSGQTGRGPWSGRTALADAPPSPRNAALRTLWARERVSRISDSAPETPETKAQVTALGLRHSLMTAHTSFVAIDDGAEVAAAAPANPAPEASFGALHGAGGGGASGLLGTVGGGGQSLGVIGGIDSGGGLGFAGGGPAMPGGSSAGPAQRAIPVAVVKLEPRAEAASTAWITEVRALLKRRAGALRACVEVALAKDPSIGRAGSHFVGTIALTLIQNPSEPNAMHQTNVKATLTLLPDEPLRCLERVVRRIRFPATVVVPLVLQIALDLRRS